MKTVLLIFLCSTFSYLAQAQDSTKLLQKSAELLQVMNMQETFQIAMQTRIDMEIKEFPQIAPFRDEMTAFLNKYFSWDAIKNDVAALYADYFDEKELDELIAFYKTDIGQKILSVSPELTVKAMQIGQEKVKAHLGELQQIIEEKMKADSTNASVSDTTQ